MVITEDGEDLLLNEKQTMDLMHCNEEALDSACEDLCNISDLNEPSILHLLRKRYREDKIYTNVSSILISVNPFKLLPLYTSEMLDYYKTGVRDKAPHVFATAHNAFHDMLSNQHDQSVVISGESGAGKSEATKLILQFLTEVAGQTESSGKKHKTSELEQQLLAANPILEAFGNAKTLRNNNSSRFGKLITVNFDKTGAIIGGGIINYLLEKSRVVGQAHGERNYHIFYQLLTLVDTDPNTADDLHLSNAELFHLTNDSGTINVEGISDEKDFEDFQNSMNILKFSEEQKKGIFTIVAGVLHFGNVVMKSIERDNVNGSEIENPDVLATACQLWGVDKEATAECLTYKKIGADKILVAYNAVQALDARDAMCKRVYADLFQNIVDHINVTLSAGNKPRHKFIGVLDIFGFESFEVNSFEQLCINYCNEKLQYHFNEHIFSMEQALYAQEAIKISSSSFVDNQPCLDLLELKVSGLYAMCDEEINVPRGSDEGLLNKIFKRHNEKGKAHPNIIQPAPRQCIGHTKCFGIQHYAGPVYYNVTGFLEKNKDQVHADILTVLSKSTMPLVRTLIPAPAAAQKGGRGGPSKTQTLGGQFKTQLVDLINTLNSTAPHFVRCMKPNELKAGDNFNSGRMQEQLRYAGLVEVCRIRKLGYPVRLEFKSFYGRFRCINLTAKTLDVQLDSFVKKGLLVGDEWAKGNTRVFMRTAQSQRLELAREVAILEVLLKVQRNARRFICMQRYKGWKILLNSLEQAISFREKTALIDLIDMSFELPLGGGHLDVVKRAKALQARLQDEERICAVLGQAIKHREITALRLAVASAQTPKMTPALADTLPQGAVLVSKAQKIIERLEAESALRAELTKAITARDLQQLRDALGKCSCLQPEPLVCQETKEGQALLVRLEEEEASLQDLTAAAAAATIANMDSLDSLFEKCTKLGLENHALYTSAQARHSELYGELQKKLAVDEAAHEAARIAAEKKHKEMLALKELRSKEIAAAAASITAAVTAAVTVHEKGHVTLEQGASTLEQLDSAIGTMMETGFTDSPELAEAKNVRKLLGLKHDHADKLTALVDDLKRSIQENPSSLTQEHLKPLSAAIDEVKASDIPKKYGITAVVSIGTAAIDQYSGVIESIESLKASLKSGDKATMRKALDNLENLDVGGPDVREAKDILRAEELARRAASAKDGTSPVTNYDEAEAARSLRHEIARQARFILRNYPALRSPDDFAKGMLFSKALVKENFLIWQKDPVPKSLTDLQRNENKVAVQIFKDLLGYMGDKQMPFPAMLAHDILSKGFESPGLRDEIYIQIVKQISRNARAESIAKGWQMMCMCAATFPPSVDFENFLLHFILDRYESSKGAVRDYAKYCLRILDGMLSAGEGSGFVPSVEEIQAYKERPPILATIELVDGNVITEDLPITPDFNVKKVLEICSGWLDLKDERSATIGMFVVDMGDNEEARDANDPYSNSVYTSLPRTPRLLRDNEFMGDVIVQKSRQKRNFKFVLKKKVFLPEHNYHGDDQHYERLVFLQAEDEAIVKGNITVDSEAEALRLTCLSLAVTFGPDLPEDVESLLDASMADFLLPDWRDVRSLQEWAMAILAQRGNLLSQSSADMQSEFVDIVSKSPTYGMHWFYVLKVNNSPEVVKQLPKKLILGFNADGMHCYSDDMEFLVTFAYADIYRWGGSSSQFCLIIFDADSDSSFELIVATAQASDIAATILDHIQAIMSIGNTH
jgi:myosin heavy subunit